MRSHKKRTRAASEYVFEPFPGGQTAFVECTTFDCFFGGQKGPGKSFGLLGDFWRFGTQYQGARGLLVRKTLGELRDLIEDSKRIFGPNAADWEWHAKDKEWVSPKGSILRFGYLDSESDVDIYWGHNIQWLGVDEAGNFPRPDPIDKLTGSLRSTAGIPTRRRLTGNPGGPGSGWLKRRYITESTSDGQLKRRPPFVPFDQEYTVGGKKHKIRSVFIPGRLEENIYINTEQYEANLAIASSGNEARYSAWREGNWDILAGQYFDIFTTGLHTRPHAELRIEPWWDRWISMDWGYSDDTAIHWHAIDENRTVYTYREIVVNKTTPTEIGNMIGLASKGDEGKFTGFYIGRDVFDQRSSSNTLADQIAAVTSTYNLPWPSPAGNHINDKVSGLQLMYSLMKSGHWLISENCKVLIESLPTLVRDEKNPETIADSSMDHAPDSVRYGLKCHIGSSYKPDSVVIMTKIMAAPDHTSRFIADLKAREKGEEASGFFRKKPRYASRSH